MIFGPETFEGASLPGLFDSVATSSGAATVALDGDSVMSQQYSVRFAATGEGGALAQKVLDTGEVSLNIQFLIKLSSDFVLPTEGYMVVFRTDDIPNSQNIYFAIEDYGSLRLALNGTTIGYINTNIDLTKDVLHKFEIQIIKSATTGRIRMWLDNDTEGSPNYDSGDINTAAGSTNRMQLGVQYTPSAFTGNLWLDNVYADTAFIGNQVPPFRFTNLPGTVFNENDTVTIYAERLNEILERLEALEQ